MSGWIKFLGSLCFAFTCFMAFGQEGEREFRVLAYGDALFEGILYERTVDGESEVTELAFVPDRKSIFYRLAEEDRLEFFRMEDGARGSSKRVEVGKVDWPKGAERVLLVFLKQEGGLRILAVDESPGVWGAGCFRFLNLSGAELDCRFGDTSFEVPLEFSEILRLDPEYRDPVRLQLRVPWRGERKMIYATRTVGDPRFGKLLVIKPPKEEGSLRIRVETLW